MSDPNSSFNFEIEQRSAGESENKDFIVDLSSKHPELTKSQFQVCLYLRSGFDTKAIAEALDLSIRSVESHCYRIRKKIRARFIGI